MITINMGADAARNAVVETYNKRRAIGIDDADQPHVDATTLAIIATKNRAGGSDGQPI